MPYTMAMRTLTITAIVLVAVIMVIGAVAPAIPLAHAGHPCGEIGRAGHTCIPQEKPTCAELAQEMRDRGVPEQVVGKFLDHCVD